MEQNRPTANQGVDNLADLRWDSKQYFQHAAETLDQPDERYGVGYHLVLVEQALVQLNQIIHQRAQQQ